ncbi:carbohydrate-binding protein [Glycomyces harbinensis]|uniref:Carbohydrate binding module (Family 6) n=1 Tax=Glycomyces harbinensis TaxID=58114 RepID=A0A1G6ZYC8_9ACTN|nr:carbohydrate-binding protein [Glycomyces harbinensis]SDE07247.1 Carbohydrate binding module (family 6) [Glycomyces harbinensis]
MNEKTTRRARRLRAPASAVIGLVAVATATLVAMHTADAATVRYEAESAPAVCDGAVESNHAGYSGSGFCNSGNAVGASAQFTVNAAGAGNASLAIRYANGATDTRAANLLVNGATVQSASAFGATGGWTAWSTRTVTVPLNAGSNTIRLEASTSSGLANIDYVEITDGTPSQTGVVMEDLGRGVTVVPASGGNLVSWRLLGTDAQNTAFNVYRNGTLLNSSPITGATNYLDSGGSGTYSVAAVNGGTVGSQSTAEAVFNSSGYRDIPISAPAGGTTPSGESYTYVANDMSVGDLDGDGQYEYLVKWDPTNAKDNSQSGYTGNVFIDAYELDGTRLWRIDLGRNIRAGAHYTQFQVYDYDSDGDAEIAMKTADGTRSGTGQVVGSSSADHRNSGGYILAGPEYLTIFNGANGAILDTIDYQPARGTVSNWGDNYGNRVDRFLAGTAYLDGQHPSMVFARGYYTRSVIWTVDFNGTDLVSRWVFDSNSAGSQYTGQGAHSLSIADLNSDGRQDIVYGAMAVGSNGQALWNTGFGHGDALHVSDFVPGRAGQEVFMVHEDASKPSSHLNGSNGSILFQTGASGDNGRGVAANVLASNPGAEYWSSNVSGLLNASGSNIGAKPGSANFLSWWDGDGERELLDGTQITNYPSGTLLSGSGVASNNGTKSTPGLSADLFGDWREEVVWRTSNNTALRIYATNSTTSLRIPTLMHDAQYRVAIAWQNTAYNQPPHPSFYIGSDVTNYPIPAITTP